MPDDNFREQVRERTDLIQLVERSGVQVRHSSGRTVKCKCPFHDDSTASLALWPDQGRWRCFGACSEGGDVFAWVMKRDNVDFRAALEILARDAGLEMPVYVPDPEKEKARLDAQQIMDLAAGYYHDALLNQAGAQAHRDYLIARGFGEETWQRWNVGAAGNQNGLNALFKKQGVDLKLAGEIGLLQVDDKGELTGRDFLRNRVVIPWIDNGKVTFFTGRTIVDAEPKYLHIHNSQYFKKTPYNWRTTGKDLLIVEGPLDVWAADALLPSTVGVVGLMGLMHSDPLLAKTTVRRETVYVGLDSDGTVRPEVVEGVVQVAGVERVRLVQWPGDDDAAKMLASGGTAEQMAEVLGNSPYFLADRLRLVKETSDEDKPKAVERAVEIASWLPPARRDGFIAGLKKVVRGIVQAKTIDQMVGKVVEVKDAENQGSAPKADPSAYYRIVEDELWAGSGENAVRLMIGGYAIYHESVYVDDGEVSALALGMKIKIKGGSEYESRLEAAESGEEKAVLKVIKEKVGPFISIASRTRKQIPEALEGVSRDAGVNLRTEIAHTGWITTANGWCYCTPGGVVGTLPEGYSVALPKSYSEGFSLIDVHDAGDEPFKLGLDGLIDGLLKAFEPEVVYPMLAFALCPVASPWLPKRKFALHMSGETGSLKTHTAKVVMSLYGGMFASNPPLLNWRSTVNAIELAGFWLPDMVALIDDYKPSIVKRWDFTELIQRYADGNARLRLNSGAEIRRKQAFRAWLLSTGEDIPIGESSVLARMILVRFPRRPRNAVYNTELAKAQRLAPNFPTVTARWAAWLVKNQDDLGFAASLAMHHQGIGKLIQDQVPGAPNASRVAENFATLQVIWSAFCDFLDDAGVDGKLTNTMRRDMAVLVRNMAVRAAQDVADEKPTRVFLEALQAGLDSGEFYVVPLKGEPLAGRSGFAGYFDEEGVYLLPASYQLISRWFRMSGNQVGFHQKELYRLLHEEGLLVKEGKHETTIVVKVGSGNKSTARVLHLKPGLLIVSEPASDDVPAYRGSLFGR